MKGIELNEIIKEKQYDELNIDLTTESLYFISSGGGLYENYSLLLKFDTIEYFKGVKIWLSKNDVFTIRTIKVKEEKVEGFVWVEDGCVEFSVTTGEIEIIKLYCYDVSIIEKDGENVVYKGELNC